MKSGKSFDSSAIEKNGIHMEIWEPSLIVLPIPKNNGSNITPIEINVTITNNTSRLFPFFYGRLMPELVNAQSQVLHPKKLSNKSCTANPYDGMGIPPGRTLVCSLIAQLSWQNKFLQLQATIAEPPRLSVKPNKLGSFEPLQLGTYQLQFTYLSPSGDFSFADSHTGEVNRIEGFEASLLATPWINFQLIEPVGINNKAVEVDGMRFETILAEPSLSIPVTQSEVCIPECIGIKITNNTSTSFYFCLFDTLIPELIRADGLMSHQSYGATVGWVSSKKTDFQLVTSGKSITLFSKAYFQWQPDGLLSLIFPVGDRACWMFKNISLGRYGIQLTYRYPKVKSEVLFENAWVGMVHTPFVEFQLVQS